MSFQDKSGQSNGFRTRSELSVVTTTTITTGTMVTTIMGTITLGLGFVLTEPPWR